MGAPTVISADASGLAEVVERARKLLDEGDVIAARMLAAAAYDQAKAVNAFAERAKASSKLVDKARRLQGDALLIEARAKMTLADGYDEAQERGEVAGHGGKRKSKLPDENLDPPTTADIGLTSKDIHEARKLRDAEKKAPGIVERAIEARIMEGFAPTRRNLNASIGTKTATAVERGDNLYETPIEAVRTLLALRRFAPTVWEPACGRGAISRPLEAAGYEVTLSDLNDYGTATKDGELQRVEDFLRTQGPASDEQGARQRPSGSLRAGQELTLKGGTDIVTNPPYGEVLNAFIAHALRAHRPARMALLLNLNFLCGFEDPDRRFAMDDNAPAEILVFTRRLPMMHRDGWDGPKASSSMNTAWFIWELRPQPDGTLGYGGPTTMRRVDWKACEDCPALPPLSADASCDSAADVATASPPSGLPAISPSRGEIDGSEVGGELPKPWFRPPEGADSASSPVAVLQLRWHQANPPHGRILAMAGPLEAGAIFPPAEAGGHWTYSYWLGRTTGPHKRARTEASARRAIEAQWAAFCATSDKAEGAA